MPGPKLGCCPYRPGVRSVRSPWHALLVLLLVACAFPGSVKPTVKIGLAAPFEGLYRDLGYEVLHAVRLAVRQCNEAGGVGGRYLVELVALNDLNEPHEAAMQARELAADPGVLGAVGGWSPETQQAARPEYERLGLALLAPSYVPEVLAAEAARVAVSELGIQQAAIICAEHAQHVALGRALASELGARDISVDSFCPGVPADWIEATGLGSAGFGRLLFVAADTPTSASWVQQARKAGFEGPVMGGPMVGSRLVPEIAGDASDGVLFVSAMPSASADPAFIEAYQGLSTGAPPGPLATWAFGATRHLLAALEEASATETRPTRRGVAEAISARPIGEVAVHVYRIEGADPFVPPGY